MPYYVSSNSSFEEGVRGHSRVALVVDSNFVEVENPKKKDSNEGTIDKGKALANYQNGSSRTF